MTNFVPFMMNSTPTPAGSYHLLPSHPTPTKESTTSLTLTIRAPNTLISTSAFKRVSPDARPKFEYHTRLVLSIRALTLPQRPKASEDPYTVALTERKPGRMHLLVPFEGCNTSLKTSGTLGKSGYFCSRSSTLILRIITALKDLESQDNGPT